MKQLLPPPLRRALLLGLLLMRSVVAAWAQSPLQEGQGEVQLSVRGLATGLYVGILQVEGHVLATRKLAVTR